MFKDNKSGGRRGRKTTGKTSANTSSYGKKKPFGDQAGGFSKKKTERSSFEKKPINSGFKKFTPEGSGTDKSEKRRPFLENKGREKRTEFSFDESGAGSRKKNTRDIDKKFNPGDKKKPGFKDKLNKQAGSFSNDKKVRSFGDGEKYVRKTLAEKQEEKKEFIKKKFEKRGDSIEIETPIYDELKAPKKITRSHSETKDGIRLNRYIANSGVCSRRDADLLIQAGEIKVNGTPVTEMGYIVQPTDIVKYGNRTLKREKLVYVLLNKPKDFITTTNDPDERRTVMDLVSSAAKERLYPVGRLDRNTTGLLILTNDGELAEKLAHPSNKVRKIYEVVLDKPLDEDDFDRILKGVYLEDGNAKVDELAIISPDRQTVGIELHIGRNRIVRRIFEYLGYQVERLDRVMYAHLTKKDLPRGHWRYLTEKEVVALKFMNRKG